MYILTLTPASGCVSFPYAAYDSQTSRVEFRDKFNITQELS